MRGKLNPLRPKRPVKPKPKFINPSLQFAYDFKMISDQEYQWCLEGNMDLIGQSLLNLNVESDFCSFPTGTTVGLYQDRKYDLMIEDILGLNENK